MRPPTRAPPQYAHEVPALQQKLSGLSREELQRALGVKPMDRSSKYRGVSKKKGRWEAKVCVCVCLCACVRVWVGAEGEGFSSWRARLTSRLL